MFWPKKFQSINDVVETQLCTGCGACAFAEPDRFQMGDAVKFGRRPFLKSNPAEESGEGLKVCPGIELSHSNQKQDPELIKDLWEGWGPVYGVWEGYATEDDIRLAGSSGGAATALALYCLEKEGIGRVVHSAASPEFAFLNETVVSTSKADLLTTTGSRYAPASPCEGLGAVVEATDKSVFIGKPCDVAAVAKSRKINQQLDSQIGATIAFFCAGVPSTFGNLELLKREGVVDPIQLSSLRYRGNGWPGLWTAVFSDAEGNIRKSELTYNESWGFLQKYRQWRCYICPDHTGEFADIAVGDPWYRAVKPGEAGKSLIVARTRLGLDLVRKAAGAGYIYLETEDSSLLPRSQPGLLAGRGAIWARLLVLRAFGAATPRLHGFSLFQNWVKHLNLVGKVRSVTGTVKRVFIKKLRFRVAIEELEEYRRGTRL